MRRPDPPSAALRDPLLARLASPGVDLELAQIASTIGRDVDRELLQRVAGLRDETFRASWRTCWPAACSTARASARSASATS